MNPFTPAPLALVRKLKIAGGRTVSLGALIGTGSQGRVYAGQISGEWGGPRTVAVKVFDLGDHDAGACAILSEAAQRAAFVHHPHVAQTYDFDLTTREPFIVSELVGGGSLETLIQAYAGAGQHIPQDLAILLAIKIAEGLAGALSSAKLVHGAVSPRDVLISWSGEVKVTDFGLSAASSALSMIRPVDTVLRLAFVAPEVACGSPATARSDVFSLGIVLHHMLFGQRFSPHTSPREAITLVRDGVVHKSLFEPHLLQPLRAILRRCTERNALNRYAHAGEVAAELKTIAVLLGIPDVPAYIANALEAVFGTEDADALVETLTRAPGNDDFVEVDDNEIFDADQETFEAEIISAPTGRSSGIVEKESAHAASLRRRSGLR